MHKLIITVSVAGALALAVPAAALAQPSAPAVRASAVLAFKHDKVSHGVKPVFTYKTAHLPSGAVIDLQRQYGSAHVWKNVERLRAGPGTATAPGVPMGKYDYRLRVTKSGRTVVTSAVRPLYSYGTVAFSTLCAYVNNGPCSSNTVQIGTTIFTYYLSGSNVYPTYSAIMKFPSTSCSNMSVEFGTDDTTSGAHAYVEMIQSRTDPQYGSTPIATIEKFSPTLDGGPFYLEVSETGGYTVYLNGPATCYTASGLP